MRFLPQKAREQMERKKHMTEEEWKEDKVSKPTHKSIMYTVWTQVVEPG